jgi:hypothetical protein
MPINRANAKTNYTQGAQNNSQKLVTNFVAKTGKIDAARSDAAEALYAANTQAAIARKARQKALANVTESQMNAAMQATGATAYGAGVERSKDKWASHTEPFLAALDGLEGRYPARTSDPMANLTNRAGLVVKTLSDLKKRTG